MGVRRVRPPELGSVELPITRRSRNTTAERRRAPCMQVRVQRKAGLVVLANATAPIHWTVRFHNTPS
jgi:hypothetical protein